MREEVLLLISPETAGNPDRLKNRVARELSVDAKTIAHVEPLRRSIDARSKRVKIRLKVAAYLGAAPQLTEFRAPEVQSVDHAPPVVIVGAGPAGLFACLTLIEKGLKPVLVERGKDVRSRLKDLAAISRQHVVDPNSNYCFGEGGAGTYSDGKLYTRSTKRGDVREILETLVRFGAPKSILVDAHPHIGSNKLPGIIGTMRKYIQQCGGEVHFGQQVTDFHRENGRLTGVSTAQGKTFVGAAVLLATGHSARDIFELLHAKSIALEAKPFALGVRVEHPQSLIDQIQYHQPQRGEWLPAASYSLVHQVDGRGVFSFCMCPGGIIAPCATSPGEVVTNGWSPSQRNTPYANSGIVVSVDPKDYQATANDPLSGLRFQQNIEKLAWEAGGRSQVAPAQRLVDFVANRASHELPKTSYFPGVAPAKLGEVLPPFVNRRLQRAFKAFGKKMRGYMHPEAVVVGVESRTSSPVRIPRDPESLQHPQVPGLYPCGEGGGYAGGIVSAAMDGQRCARKMAEAILRS